MGNLSKQIITLPKIQLVGLTVRTNNATEMNPKTSKIAALTQKYFSEQLSNSIKYRVKPGVTYSAYTEFDDREFSDYTFFIGEAVSSFNDQDTAVFTTHAVPNSIYQRFTTQAGTMPTIVIDAWQEIWSMTENDFEGKRRYITDFELYDERAQDPQNTILDIYIGIDKS